MRYKVAIVALILFTIVFAIVRFNNSRAESGNTIKKNVSKPDDNKIEFEGEKHLRNIKQLSFGGQNAEAYFVADGSKLIFQSTREGVECDQIFTMNPDGSDVKMVSTGDGRTTCSYIYPNKQRLLYASTHLGAKQCPPAVDMRKGYAWAVYPTYDIFTADMNGKDVKQLTNAPGYDAEATISRNGKKIAFTSLRDGDLDIYVMDADGKNVKRLTTEPGYDGGPFWSADGKKIVFRSYHPKTEAEILHYKQKLDENLIEPNTFEIWVMDADGKNKRQITRLNTASFAPFFHPDGKRIIFSSNYNTGNARNFDLYIVNVDGTGLEKITSYDSFDGFPMFSPDGKKLVFASNRNGKVRGETNIFIADWIN